ncbi:MAG: hypothetical protein ACOYMG_08490 [Candidatus Methylumidiphilus sp.]
MNAFTVCFYDPTTDTLVGLKDFFGSPDSISYAGLLHANTYQFDKHSMPSSIWLAFNSADVLRIFFLDSYSCPDQAVLLRIDELVREMKVKVSAKPVP